VKWENGEGVRDVTRDEDTLNAEINPGSAGQVREGNTPFFFALVDVGFE
jgi:hypothetical protein